MIVIADTTPVNYLVLIGEEKLLTAAARSHGFASRGTEAWR
jgi:hypothetical protein